jgi:hypothetical protein
VLDVATFEEKGAGKDFIFRHVAGDDDEDEIHLAGDVVALLYLRAAHEALPHDIELIDGFALDRYVNDYGERNTDGLLIENTDVTRDHPLLPEALQSAGYGGERKTDEFGDPSAG